MRRSFACLACVVSVSCGTRSDPHGFEVDEVPAPTALRDTAHLVELTGGWDCMPPGAFGLVFRGRATFDGPSDVTLRATDIELRRPGATAHVTPEAFTLDASHRAATFVAHGYLDCGMCGRLQATMRFVGTAPGQPGYWTQTAEATVVFTCDR